MIVDNILAVLVQIPLVVMRALYGLLKRQPQQDKVVLMSRLHSRTSADFERLLAELRRQSPGTAVAVLNHRRGNVFAVVPQTLSQMYHLATSRACITDSYMATISVLEHRPTLVVVQVWHALGAIKRFGRAALDSPEGRPGRFAEAMNMHHGYDWVVAGGPGMVGPFAEAFGVRPEQVLPIGSPRIDILRDEAATGRVRQRLSALHPELGRRPLVLYAPTFRIGRPVQVEPLLDALADHDLDIALALHPLDIRDFAGRPGVIHDRTASTLDWLAIADHVISDYSAIVFDTAAIGTPLYFYLYDLDDYVERRGLFVDVADLPGPVSRDAGELATAVVTGGGSRERVARFRERYLVEADGGSARRIVELALGRAPAELS
ncbi:MAG: CDP-glycerol glycerophosphotransferase family protein [Actinomycetota bacterium]|nr:CDP-glycerol glycerophosphotransferase family protein [Actinomycetota bacterium]